MSVIRISAEQAARMLEEGASVVDIRDAHSFAAGTIEGAVHISADNVDEFIAASDRSRPLIVCCYHGNASQGAAAYFSEQGFEQACSLDGGYEAWKDFQDGGW
jgi:thiosulfate sulfurtransferase